MPGLILHVGAVVQCAHSASAQIIDSQQVLVSGQPVATSDATNTVLPGCPFNKPCASIRWILMSSRVLVGGKSVLLQVAPGPGAGVCQAADQTSLGPPQVLSMQSKVTAS